jgi:hypothetical protein
MVLGSGSDASKRVIGGLVVTSKKFALRATCRRAKRTIRPRSPRLERYKANYGPQERHLAKRGSVGCFARRLRGRENHSLGHLRQSHDTFTCLAFTAVNLPFHELQRFIFSVSFCPRPQSPVIFNVIGPVNIRGITDIWIYLDLLLVNTFLQFTKSLSS